MYAISRTKVHEVNTAELRARFDKEINAPDKKLLWEELQADGYVGDVLQDESGWEEFKERACRVADRQRKLLGRAKPIGRVPRDSFDYVFPPINFELTDLEAEHAAALAPYLAQRASLLPEVRDFREEKLGGGTLDTEQVAPFLRREFAHLPREEYADLEWALEQVPSYFDGNEEEELKDLIGGSVNRGADAEARRWSENFRRAVEFDSMAMDYVPSRQFEHGLMQMIRDEAGRTLEDLGLSLASRYPWPLRDAAWFVLTDQPPEVEVLEIGFDNGRGTYNITFAPWISEKTRQRAYRSVQEGDNRPLGNKGLSAFRFVCEHTEPGRTPKWAELTERWNEQHPHDKFRDRSELRRMYKRAEERLVSPWVKEQEPEVAPGF